MSAASPETAILTNTCGSLRYAEFLARLGQLVPLKNRRRQPNANFDDTYLDGLDTTEACRDGKYTYHWKDEILQVCFHVATMMPNSENDVQCVNKKRHIGNDAVHIVYNDSGQDYRNGLIKSQFNYASVVIKPIEHGENVIRVQTKAEVAEMIGHDEPQIVSDANLSLFVRQLAIHAHMAARIHVSLMRIQKMHSGVKHPHTNNWVERSWLNCLCCRCSILIVLTGGLKGSLEILG